MATLWEKIQFWKNPRMLKEFKDYRLFDYSFTDGKKVTGIQLMMNEYANVCYHYNDAQIIEEGEVGKLKFGFGIIDPGEHDLETLINDDKFVIIMGEILTEVLLKKINDDDATGKNNTQKFGV